MSGGGECAVAFDALEYRSDQSFGSAHFEFRRDPLGEWEVWRNGSLHLRLGGGYRVMRARACGVCSTDLERHNLPFALPQVIGHEVIAVDGGGRRHVVEINASPAACGSAGDCGDCRDDLGRHCPRRLVLGIHDLPGGFGRWLLAPIHAVVPVPAGVPDEVAVMVEPFAAAWHAVETIGPRGGDEIAVVGPRKLGMLIIAALASLRRRTGVSIGVTAIVRRDELGAVARRMGADRVVAGADPEAFDVVVDTTGDPDALEWAIRLARREVHVKSTHGRPSAGLANLTAFVVDELRLARYEPSRLDGLIAPLGWLSSDAAPERDPRWSVGSDASALRAELEARADASCIVGMGAVVVDDLQGVDAAIRPSTDQRGLVRPRGTLFLRGESGAHRTPLERAVLERDLTLSSSRCGDFRSALEVLTRDEELRRAISSLVTHRFRAAELPAAFATARTRSCIKAVVLHETGGPDSASS